jgi:hypothetical protein
LLLPTRLTLTIFTDVSIHAYIRFVKYVLKPCDQGSLEGDGWANWLELATSLAELSQLVVALLNRLWIACYL